MPTMLATARPVAAALAALLALAAAQPGTGQQGSWDPDGRTQARVTVAVNRPGGLPPFRLRLPRFLRENPGGWARTANDTCGHYDILYTPRGAQGSGPPPHLHYSSDEWFLLLGSGSVRMYQAQEPAAPIFAAGQLPGYNAPAVAMGSALIGPGDALFSPAGSVHYFARETATTDFLAVHAPGWGMEEVIEVRRMQLSAPMFACATHVRTALAARCTGLLGGPLRWYWGLPMVALVAWLPMRG